MPTMRTQGQQCEMNKSKVNAENQENKEISKTRNFLKYNFWILILDIVAFGLSYLLALYIRFFVNGKFYGSIAYYQDYFWTFIPIYIVASVVVFALFKLYGGMWQYAGLHDLNRILLANIVTIPLHIGISVLVISNIQEPEISSSLRMPVSYYVIGAVIQFILTASLRFINRLIQEEKRRLSFKSAVPVMVVGTGETSRIVRRQLEEDPETVVRIVCIFTYRDYEAGSLLDGVPVVNHLDQLKNHIERYQVKRVILADSLMPMHVRETIRNTCQEINIEMQDFSGYLRYDNTGVSFQKLMECADGKVVILQDDVISRYEDGEQALMAVSGRHDVKSVGVRDNCLFVELISFSVNPLIVFFITNRPDVALVAEKYGVDRIWVDLEVLDKEERQRNMNTVKSNHTIADIAAIKPLLSRASMMVRINHWHDGSKQEIEDVLAAGADIIMLPYWKTPEEVKFFLEAVHGRAHTSLLLETKEAVECIDEVLTLPGIDEIHIGLRDLHLSYGMSFMFEPLADGTVEMLCNKFKKAGVPYGFGGIAKLGDGMLPAEKIIMEHYRLGSTRAILSRSFCDTSKISNIEDIEKVFRENMEKLREYELSMANTTSEQYVRNKMEIAKTTEEIAERIRQAHSLGM